MSAGPAARRLVHQFQARFPTLRQRRDQVGNSVRGMVQPWAAFGKELSYRAVGTERGQQFYLLAATGQENHFHPLILQHLTVDEGHTHRLLVQVQAVRERCSGDPDMVKSSKG